ncbi:MAG: response regulator [Chitinispirillia bacterium]|jgi:CheY-like chemotaxis protein
MNQQDSEVPIEILLVEDNPGDVRLTKEAFRECKVKINISVATDGSEAINFLRNKGQYKNTIKPDLILLDLNLPKVNGIEVLKEIKSDPNLRMIPVIILTTSKADDDIMNTYINNANCYINKPVDLDGFFRIIESIESFWFSTAVFPPAS